MTAIDFSKHQALNTDLKAMQQINLIENLENNARMFFVIEGTKQTILEFSQGIVRVL